jgi:hypothetical protein
LYNSTTETFFLFAQNQILSYLFEWNVANDQLSEFKTFSFDLDIPTLLKHDKEEAFFKKEFWSVDTASKYKDKMIFNYAVLFVTLNNLNLCFRDISAPNVYNEVLALGRKECFVGPACGPSYSEIPIFSLGEIEKIKHLYEFDYSLRAVTCPVKYNYLENKQ